jgi:hypothetical protein
MIGGADGVRGGEVKGDVGPVYIRRSVGRQGMVFKRDRWSLLCNGCIVNLDLGDLT